MCGVAGFFYRDPGRLGPVGQTILRMLAVLGSRGTDGVGVALYGAPTAGGLIVRLWSAGATPGATPAGVQGRLRGLAEVETAVQQRDYMRLVLRPAGGEAASLPAWIAAVAAALERAGDAEIFSAGRTLEVIKSVGVAGTLGERYAIGDAMGSHGIGHTRLATESRVDVSHCHPFWARPYPDIAVVHNGQITNYRTLRRLMEMRGTHFATGNDSEIIALYLAERLQRGMHLEEALRCSLEDLDGTFTYLVSTAQGIGMAKDPFATKPLVVTETDDWVALASEETALCAAFEGPLRTYEPPAGEVKVWLH